MNNNGLNDVDTTHDDDVLRAVCECVSEVLGVLPADLSASLTLDELGADSFHRMHLVLQLERRFMIRLPSSYAAASQRTIGDYALAVVGARADNTQQYLRIT